MAKLNTYIININRLLKDIKSNVLVNFMHSNNKDIIIIANKIATILDLNIMEKYIKKVNDVDVNNVISSKLS